MDETEELIRLCVRALVAQMGDVPGVEMHMTRDCILGLTGEPLADFNMLTLGPDPDAEGFLTRSVARAQARGLPLTAMMSPHVAQALGATEAGQPLYLSLGFEPIADLTAWLLEALPEG